MAGVNQYRRRWSTQYQPRRSRTATIGRGMTLVIGLAALATLLYIFGIVGPDPRHHRAGATAVATLVPPPAALVVPTTIGPFEPFGTLPPVIPFIGNAPGLTLAYTLSGPLTGGAPRADVFRVAWGAPAASQVDELARKLGLTGPVRQPNAGVYTVDGNGSLSVDAKMVRYTPPVTEAAGNTLPNDQAAISSARAWLAAHAFLPPDVGAADVRRDGEGLDVIFHPKMLPDILSDTPGIRVHMAAGGVVTEVARAWPTELTPGAYDLIALDDAWRQLATRGVVDFRLPADAALPANATGSAVIDNVSLAYALATDKGGADYLQPVYLFSGRVALPGPHGSADIRVAVPAVRNIRQPAG